MSTATITSKGQVTLPVEVRRELGFNDGDKLTFSVNPVMKTVEVKKVMTIDELQAMVQSMIKPGIKPLENVHEYYEKQRAKEIMERLRESV
jgi:antitoxin PrlF